MIHARSLAEFPPAPDRPALLTLGSFDGVHLGHQALIHNLVQSAHDRGYHAVIVTFFPHPAIVLRGPRPAFYLTLPDEKAALFEQLGVDILVTHPFTLEVSQLTAGEFIARLHRAFDFREIWCGADFAFGHRREGTVDWLRSHGYSVKVIEPAAFGGAPISSSRIRQALAEGDLAQANDCLGRPFRLMGVVVEGSRRGRALGFPTANMQIAEEQAYPARGVYACRASLGAGEVKEAVVNIGVRPTFGAADAPIIEAHLLDFDGDLYGQTLRLDFMARLRPEQKFNGVDELLAQIRRDIEQAKSIL